MAKFKILHIFGLQRKVKEKTPAERIQELIPALKDYVPAIRGIMNEVQNGREPSAVAFPDTDGAYVGRLYDFFVNHGDVVPNDGYTTFGVGANPAQMSYTLYGDQAWTAGVTALPAVAAPVVQNGVVVKKDIAVRTKPIDVLEFLEHVPAPIQMEDLDTKIATCKDKVSLVYQRYAKEHLENVIKCLEYRKVYKDHMAYFNQFPYTSNEAIDKLVTNYKLVIRKADLFIPEFPKEAIDIMKEYTAKVKEITGKGPNFYVIAEQADFEKKVKKNDPILLVQSIFGFFWQILGAWDKELLLLSEL